MNDIKRQNNHYQSRILLKLNINGIVCIPHDKKWSRKGKIVKILPYRSYLIEMSNGKTLRRNRRHILPIPSKLNQSNYSFRG